MRFSVSISDFRQVLQKVLPAIPAKATMEVLEYLNLKLDEDTLKIIASDQSLMIMAKVDVEKLPPITITKEDGSTEQMPESDAILVPGKKLFDIIKELGNVGNVEFIVNSQNRNIEIKTDKGKYDIKGLDPDEYLDLPLLFEDPQEMPDDMDSGLAVSDIPKVVFFEDQIKYLCDKTAISISKDEFRIQMNGVFFEFKGDKVHAVSTDSYRLTRARISSERPVYPEDVSVIIPQKAIEYLRKSNAAVDMTFIKKGEEISHVKFDYGNIIFVTNVIQEKFPPYEAVIPQANNYQLRVAKDAFVAALRRIALFTNDTTHQIKLQVNQNEMVVFAVDDTSGGQGREIVPCEFNHDGEYIIGFDVQFLIDEVNNIQGKSGSESIVKVQLGEPDKPALLFDAADEKEDLLMLLMPVRI
jgi:DNA polymerase-3 subunit beta